MQKPTHMVTTYSQSDADYMIAAAKACHRLGLTAEELDAGVLEELIEAVGEYLQGVGDKFGLQTALRPFTKESRDEKAE